MNVELRMLACDGKTKHLIYSSASIELKRVNKQRHRPGVLNVYRCKYCGHFHVGRNSKRD